MNRTLLFLLVAGLFFVAWQRNKGIGTDPGVAAPNSGTKPAVTAPTNSTNQHSLVSFEQPIHK